MSKTAIIKIGSAQYTVEEGKTYTVPKFQAEEGVKMTLDKVLAVGSEKEVVFGKPLVEGAKVDLMIEKQAKGEKISTFVYKAKSRYRRKWGFRKEVTVFKVEKITAK